MAKGVVKRSSVRSLKKRPTAVEAVRKELAVVLMLFRQHAEPGRLATQHRRLDL